MNDAIAHQMQAEQERIDRNLAAYVNRIRSLADEVEREVKRGRSPASKIAGVQHAVNWGMANAGSLLENAINALDCQFECLKEAAKK